MAHSNSSHAKAPCGELVCNFCQRGSTNKAQVDVALRTMLVAAPMGLPQASQGRVRSSLGITWNIQSDFKLGTNQK
jgi:hypothetical protein